MDTIGILRLAQLACISALASLAASGCAGGDRVVKIYEDASFSGGPFANVLVVGVGPNADNRRRFELSVADAIGAGGTSARASIQVMGGASQPVTRDSVAAAARSIGADAVLVTRLVDSSVRTETEQGPSVLEVERRDDIPLVDAFRYTYSEYEDPMVVTTIRTVVLATDLYDVTTEARVWSVESTSMNKESVYDIVDGASSALAGALARDGLIRR